MKILKAKITNFASYGELIFEFTNQGLTLVSGPTGSGKSTLCDIVPWILFGKTSKNGSVDEIRSWGEKNSTDGVLEFSHGSHSYYVRRIRGKQNDLFYGPLTDYGAEGKRGKDINDTQNQINLLIGMEVETYLMGSYYHEFSQVAEFFVTTAKVRRSIIEQLADLSLAKNLQEKTSVYNKEIKKEFTELKQDIALKNNTLQHLEKQYEANEEKAEEWSAQRATQIEELGLNSINYEEKKLQILEELFYDSNIHDQQKNDKLEEIQVSLQKDKTNLKPDAYYLDTRLELMLKTAALKADKCSECGAAKNTDQIMLMDRQIYQLARDEEENTKIKRRIIDLSILLNKTSKQINPYIKLIEQESQRKNTYEEQLDELNKKENPFAKSQQSVITAIKNQKNSIKSTEKLLNELSTEQSDIELLQNILDTFRARIIENTVRYLEVGTNKRLNDCFDAEIRVRFSAKETDKLEIEITKDGNLCSYAQLSKGQRQLLKLCFAVSIMQAIANYRGVSFNCLFFDEALDGMDDNTKEKSFHLLDYLSLEYESIFCIEHSESFKSLFNSRINVELVNNRSEIEKI